MSTGKIIHLPVFGTPTGGNFSETTGAVARGGVSVVETVTPVGAPLILLQESFADGNLAARGWYDGNAPTMSSQDGVACIQAQINSGGSVPSWVIKRHSFTPTDRFTLSYRVKYSTNWVGSGQLFHPHEWMVLSDIDAPFAPLANNFLNTYIEQNYQGGGIPKMLVQDSSNINYSQGPLPNNLIAVTENRSVSGCNGVIEPVSNSPDCFDNGGGVFYNAKDFDAASIAFTNTPGVGYKNNWNTVEVYCQMNTIVGGIAQADGIMQYRFNGTTMINRNNVVYRTGQRPNLKWAQVALAPFMNTSPATQTVWYADLLITGVAATGPATQVDFTVQPSAVNAGVIMNPPVEVSIKNAAGTVVPTATNVVSLSVNSGPGSVVGTTSRAAVGGVASFSDISMSTAGTVTLLASSPGLTSDISSSFIVSAAQGSPWPNEPAGFTLVTDYGFGDVLPQGQSQPVGSGWFINNGDASRISDPTAPISPSFVAQYRYYGPQGQNPGFGGGSAPAAMFFFTGGGNEQYTGFYWKPSNPWNFHSSGVNKIIFQFLGGGGSGGQNYLSMQNNRVIRCVLEMSTTGAVNLANNVNSTPVTLGQWHLLEWYMNKSAGIVRWWTNGVLQGNHTGINFPGNAFDECKIDPTWGGVGQNKTQEDFYWYDHIRISRHS